MLELRFLQLCNDFAIPRPLVNAELDGFLPDFYWPQERLVVETDSEAFHRSVAAKRRDAFKDVRLAELGIQLIRLRWRDVAEARAATAHAVVAALADASSVT